MYLEANRSTAQRLLGKLTDPNGRGAAHVNDVDGVVNAILNAHYPARGRANGSY